MEVRESGVTVVRSDAPSEYHIAPRTENSVPLGSPPPPVTGLGKKKRGRPRKYLPDGSLNPAVSSKPTPSSVPPPGIDFSTTKLETVRPASSVSKTKYEIENIGEWAAFSPGANFTPHIITVNPGEILMSFIEELDQMERKRSLKNFFGMVVNLGSLLRVLGCYYKNSLVFSTRASNSSVTLRQPDSSGGTLTYEGRFEILSLSGSFTPNDTRETRSKTGGMSVSLASPDGRVVGGGIAGLLVASSAVQVVVGSFLAGNQQEQKPKKQKPDFTSISPPPPAASAVPVSGENPKPNFSNPSPF